MPSFDAGADHFDSSSSWLSSAVPELLCPENPDAIACRSGEERAVKRVDRRTFLVNSLRTGAVAVAAGIGRLRRVGGLPTCLVGDRRRSGTARLLSIER